MASVIEGFLVKLGFDIDKDGMNKFNGNVANTVKMFKSITADAIKVGTAISGAFVKNIYDIDKTNKSTKLLNTTIGKFGTLSLVFKRVGGDVGALEGAIANFTSKVKENKGFEEWLKDNFDISLKDANGKLKDMSDVFLELRDKLVELNEVDPNTARIVAEYVGLGEVFDVIIRKEFDQELIKVASASTTLGRYLSENAQYATDLSNSFTQLASTAWDAVQGVALAFAKATGLDKTLDQWTKHIQETAPQTIANITTLLTGKNAKGEEVDRTRILKEKVTKAGLDLGGWLLNTFTPDSAFKEKKEEIKKRQAEMDKNSYVEKHMYNPNADWAMELYKRNEIEKSKALEKTLELQRKLKEREAREKEAREKEAREKSKIPPPDTTVNAQQQTYSEKDGDAERTVTVKEKVKTTNSQGELPERQGDLNIDASAPSGRSHPDQVDGVTTYPVPTPTATPVPVQENLPTPPSTEPQASATKPTPTVPPRTEPQASATPSTPTVPYRKDIWQVRGLRNNNPGNLNALAGDRLETGVPQGKARFAEFDTMEQGIYRMAKQLKMYYNAGSEGSRNLASMIATYAPAEDSNDPDGYAQRVASHMSKMLGTNIDPRSELDLTNPYVMRALLSAMVDQESGKGASQAIGLNDTTRYVAEIERATRATAKSRAYNKSREVASTNNVNINQTINIDGSKDPKAVAEAVTKETKEALYRNVNQNVM